MGNDASSCGESASWKEEGDLRSPRDGPCDAPGGADTSFEEEMEGDKDDGSEASSAGYASDESGEFGEEFGEWSAFLSARASVLSDNARMKEVVGWFLHPELPVPRGAQARCYFERASAPLEWLSESEPVLGVVGVAHSTWGGGAYNTGGGGGAQYLGRGGRTIHGSRTSKPRARQPAHTIQYQVAQYTVFT